MRASSLATASSWVSSCSMMNRPAGGKKPEARAVLARASTPSSPLRTVPCPGRTAVGGYVRRRNVRRVREHRVEGSGEVRAGLRRPPEQVRADGSRFWNYGDGVFRALTRTPGRSSSSALRLPPRWRRSRCAGRRCATTGCQVVRAVSTEGFFDGSGWSGQVREHAADQSCRILRR